MSDITITIQAFGYEHEFTDCFVEGDIDMIENAPVLYLVSGYDEKVDAFADGLNSDWTVFYTDAGEYIFFGYEYFSTLDFTILRMLSLACEIEDRSEEEDEDEEIAA